MEIEIERGLSGSFLVIKDENIEMAGDEITMLTGNRIPGFINVSLRNVNGTDCLYYDISSMVSLEAAKQKQEFKYKEIKEVICSLITLKNSLEEYMLSDSGVIMEPEYVFLDVHEHKIKYCFYPFYNKPASESMNVLSEFLLRSTDHADKRSVKAIYEMYAMVQNENYNFESLITVKEAGKAWLENTGSVMAEVSGLKQITKRIIRDHENEYKSCNISEKSGKRVSLLPVFLIFSCAILLSIAAIAAFFYIFSG